MKYLWHKYFPNQKKNYCDKKLLIAHVDIVQ